MRASRARARAPLPLRAHARRGRVFGTSRIAAPGLAERPGTALAGPSSPPSSPRPPSCSRCTPPSGGSTRASRAPHARRARWRGARPSIPRCPRCRRRRGRLGARRDPRRAQRRIPLRPPTAAEADWDRAVALLDLPLRRIAAETSVLELSYRPFAAACVAPESRPASAGTGREGDWLASLKTARLLPGVTLREKGATVDCEGARRLLVTRADALKSELDAQRAAGPDERRASRTLAAAGGGPPAGGLGPLLRERGHGLAAAEAPDVSHAPATAPRSGARDYGQSAVPQRFSPRFTPPSIWGLRSPPLLAVATLERSPVLLLPMKP